MTPEEKIRSLCGKVLQGLYKVSDGPWPKALFSSETNYAGNPTWAITPMGPAYEEQLEYFSVLDPKTVLGWLDRIRTLEDELKYFSLLKVGDAQITLDPKTVLGWLDRIKTLEEELKKR